MGIKISAIGAYRPKVYVSNQIWQEKFAPKIVVGEHEFAKMVTTGVKERYYAAPEETVVSMADAAITDCINKSNIDIADVDLIIHATHIPDGIDGEVNEICEAVGAVNADCYELTDVTCTGAMIAMSQVDALIKAGKYKNILVSCVANGATRFGNMSDIIASALGDLATATLFSQSEENSGFLAFHHKTRTQFVDIFDYQPLEHGVMAWPQENRDRYWANKFILVNPRRLLALHKVNTQLLPEAMKQTVNSIGLDFKDIQWLITHQAGGALELWRDLIGFDAEHHLDTFAEVGNSTMSNLPYTLMKAQDKGIFSPGDKILLASVGVGVHITTAVWQW